MHPGDLAAQPAGKTGIDPHSSSGNNGFLERPSVCFEQTPLQEIADILHENYGLTVTIENSQLASRTISGSFSARNANDVLQLIAQLLQINYIRENDRVSFTINLPTTKPITT